MYTEDDLLPLSALQHLLFCERQCAMIHVERLWSENRFTAEGRIMHERVHTADSELRGKIRTEFGVSLRSSALGLVGQADVVEFHSIEANHSRAYGWRPVGCILWWFPAERRPRSMQPSAKGVRL